jgi:hypothetical protein
MMGRAAPINLVTIPSSDAAFREHVERVLASHPARRPDDFQARLRAIFPRVTVRERALSGELPTWYVYRDGGWLPSLIERWWEAADLPRLVVSLDGWLVEADPTARAILGMGADPEPRHFTDFVVPGTLADSQALFAVIGGGRDLTATVLLRPSSGDVIAVDLHAGRVGEQLRAVFRLADDVAVPAAGPEVPMPDLECRPASDVAFRGYAELTLRRMPEPDRDLLAIQLRRLYPHANVEQDGGRWIATRETAGGEVAPDGWWRDPALPRVRYDRQALILEANEAAGALLGGSLVGHFWQEFVTPGTSEQVSTMLAILAATGAAESRFRMPRADHSLVEFDSYTTVEDDEFVTVMRPVPRA